MLTERPDRDGQTAADRVLPSTRWLAGFIAPFLVVAFVLLYGFPGDTARLWAWTIQPTMTSMMLASAYLGGAWFFVQVLRERRWTAVATGLIAVSAFATLLAVATVLHWDRFNHSTPAFWTWTFLYAVAPVLVPLAWWTNRRVAPAQQDGQRLGRFTTWSAAVFAAGGLGLGATMFAAPAALIPVWPWLLTPLTCRVLGAVFVLAGAGAGVALDARWVRVRLLVQTAVVMLVLMLVAAWRGRGELLADRPFGWLLLIGAVLALVGSVALWWTNRSGPATRHAAVNRAGSTAV